MRTSTVFLSLCVFAAPAAASDVVPTVDELLRAYENAIAHFEHAEFAATGDAFIRAEIDADEKHLNRLALLYRRDGDRLKFEMRTLGGPDSPDSPTMHIEFVRPDGGMTLWVQRTLPANGGERGRISVNGNLAGSDAEAAYLYLFNAMVVLGRCSGDGLLPLATVLRDSNPVARADQFNGRFVFVIEGQGRFGMHRLFVDPAAGFLARRIEIEKAADDVETFTMGGTDLLGSLPIGSYGIHKEKRRQVTRHCDCDIEPLDGRFAITSLRWQERITFQDEAVSVARQTYKLSDIKLGGKFSDPALFQFAVDIPEGTRVKMSDDPDVEYDWHDGQPRAVRTR